MGGVDQWIARLTRNVEVVGSSHYCLETEKNVTLMYKYLE